MVSTFMLALQLLLTFVSFASAQKSTTTVTVTSTVAASVGFKPVQTTLPNSTCDSECGPNPVTGPAKRALERPQFLARDSNVITKTTTTIVYQACATPNLADVANGQQFVLGSTTSNQLFFFAATSPYDCCVQAFTLPAANGTVEAWGFSYGQPANANCQVAADNSCTGQTNTQNFLEVNGTKATYDENTVVGNGYCGKFIHDPVPN